MKTEEIKQLFQEFELAAAEIEGVECWSARKMQTLLGYSKWENFEKVIQKAKDACKNAGEIVENHFPDVRKMVGNSVARHLTGGLGLGDDVQKIFPLGVSQQVLDVACEPVFYAVIGLLGVGFKGGGERLDHFGVHASSISKAEVIGEDEDDVRLGGGQREQREQQS